MRGTVPLIFFKICVEVGTFEWIVAEEAVCAQYTYFKFLLGSEWQLSTCTHVAYQVNQKQFAKLWRIETDSLLKALA